MEPEKDPLPAKGQASKIAAACRSIPIEQWGKKLHPLEEEIQNPDLDRVFDKMVESYAINRPSDRTEERSTDIASAPIDDKEDIEAASSYYECSECGHGNPGGNRFCGLCGAAHRSRRVSEPGGAPSVCVKCGHDNPSTAKFCNECGTPFDRGKGDNQQGNRRRLSLQTSPQQDSTSCGPSALPPSCSGLSGGSTDGGDYLLEKEPNSGSRKWAALLLLILGGLLAYLHWKTSWPAQPAAPRTYSAPAPTRSQGSAAPASEVTAMSATTPQQSAKPSDSSTDEPAAKLSTATSPDKPKSNAAAAHHSTTATDSQRDSMLSMGQKYLHGRGVRRDCEQAMVYLRAANERASASARSQMGALYATGYCVPLDRVRAYQWFTSALNVEPGNPNLQRVCNNLWTQMSSDERQKAMNKVPGP